MNQALNLKLTWSLGTLSDACNQDDVLSSSVFNIPIAFTLQKQGEMVYHRGRYISDSCKCATKYWGDGICDQECDDLECFYDYGDCGCNSDCFIYLGDGTCHTKCNSVACHNDGEDCKPGQEGESLPSTDSSSSDMSVNITFIAGITIGGFILLLILIKKRRLKNKSNSIDGQETQRDMTSRSASSYISYENPSTIIMPNITLGIPIEHPPPYEMVSYSVPIALQPDSDLRHEEESMFQIYLRNNSLS